MGAEHVTYARNITDVDDKINARAARSDAVTTIRELTERDRKQFQEDIGALGVLCRRPSSRAPRSTSGAATTIDMVRLIETLVQRGHAYVADDHVLFDVASMPDYGRFSNRSLEEMEAGARVDVAPYKKGPMDFVLVEAVEARRAVLAVARGDHEPAGPAGISSARPWPSALLGETFDIHGGGIDLVFPHHENEIAQSRCAHGTPVMANYWMHNGFLRSKARRCPSRLGNFVTIRELLRDWPGEVLRLNFMLKTHYRQPIDWTLRSLVESARTWNFIGRRTRDPQIIDQMIRRRMPFDDLNTRASSRLNRLEAEGNEQLGRDFRNFWVSLYLRQKFAFPAHFRHAMMRLRTPSGSWPRKGDRVRLGCLDPLDQCRPRGIARRGLDR